MSDQNPEPLDQTVFSESAPMMDQNGQAKPHVPQAPEKTEKAEEKPAEKRPIKKPIPLPVWIAGILVVLVLAVSLTALLMPKSPNGIAPDGTEATPTPEVASKLPPELQKAIASLEADVKEADPQANDLPFPPVNFELHLKSPQSLE